MKDLAILYRMPSGGGAMDPPDEGDEGDSPPDQG